LSSVVTKIFDLLQGIVEFLGIIIFITPPRVSTPNESGVTSSNNKSSHNLPPVSVKIAA